MKEENPSKSPIFRSIFQENAGYRIGKGCLLYLVSLFKFWAAHVSLAVLRLTFKPIKASRNLWKTARKKRPTHAPNVEAAELMNMCEWLK